MPIFLLIYIFTIYKKKSCVWNHCSRVRVATGFGKMLYLDFRDLDKLDLLMMVRLWVRAEFYTYYPPQNTTIVLKGVKSDSKIIISSWSKCMTHCEDFTVRGHVCSIKILYLQVTIVTIHSQESNPTPWLPFGLARSGYTGCFGNSELFSFFILPFLK